MQSTEKCGIIIINKPKGGSSHRCVGAVRKAMNMKKELLKQGKKLTLQTKVQ